MARINKPINVKLSPKAQEDLQFWVKKNPVLVVRISELIDSIMLDPSSGIGKPKPLKYSLDGFWSRRINSEHRVIYRVVGQTLEIVSVKGHYEKL